VKNAEVKQGARRIQGIGEKEGVSSLCDGSENAFGHRRGGGARWNRVGDTKKKLLANLDKQTRGNHQSWVRGSCTLRKKGRRELPVGN